MKIALAVMLALSLAVPAAAQLLPPGTLLLQSYVVDEQRQAHYSINALPPRGSVTQLLFVGGSDGWGETFVAPAADRIFRFTFETIWLTTDRWRSPETARLFYRGSTNIDAMVPMRSGHYLVAEVSNAAPVGKLVELDANGAIVGTHPLSFGNPQGPMPYVVAMELLADQCTLVYTGRAPRDDEAHHIRRYDICTRQQLPELTTIPFSFSEEIYAVRQLPGGDFLFGGETEVRRTTRDGFPVAAYPFSGRWLSLTPDASGFWFANVDFSNNPPAPARIGRVDFSNPHAVAYEPHLGVVHGVNGFTVIGEWRASTGQLPPAPKSRSARR
jgi:hypothetical protein